MCATYLDLTYHGRPTRFSVHPIDRARLLGATKRVALDANGHECNTAWLTRDGRHLLHAGSFADVYVNERGDTVERRDLVPVDAAGRAVATRPAMRGEVQELSEPVEPDVLLDHVVTRAYALATEALDPDLERALRGGSVFRVAFRPRKTAHPTPVFLLANADGVFLLQAEPFGFDFVGLEQVAPADTGDHDGDLDGDGERWWGDPEEEGGGLSHAA